MVPISHCSVNRGSELVHELLHPLGGPIYPKTLIVMINSCCYNALIIISLSYFLYSDVHNQVCGIVDFRDGLSIYHMLAT